MVAEDCGVSELEQVSFDLSKEYYSKKLLYLYQKIFRVYYPNPKFVEKARAFSRAVDTSLHEERNKISEKKVRGDHYWSKISEWGVYKALKDILPDLSYPSFRIHEKDDKRWSSDLFDTVTEIGVSVKYCPLSGRAVFWEESEPSFVFGYRLAAGDYDKKFFGKDACMDKSWVCLCVVDDTDDRPPATRIFFLNRVSTLYDTWLYREPVLNKLKNSKRVLYGHDLLRTFKLRSARGVSHQIANLKGIELK